MAKNRTEGLDVDSMRGSEHYLTDHDVAPTVQPTTPELSEADRLRAASMDPLSKEEAREGGGQGAAQDAAVQRSQPRKRPSRSKARTVARDVPELPTTPPDELDHAHPRTVPIGSNLRES